MRPTIILALFSLLTVLLLAGCPRDTGTDTGDSSENQEGRKPDYSQHETDAAAAADAMTEDAEAVAGEEVLDGEEALEGEDVTAEGDEKAAGEEVDADATDADATEGEEPVATDATEAEFPIVVFETTVGEIVLEVRPDWAPIGAAHFLELVEAGFYDGAPYFRVIDGFMAQTGFSGSDELNKQYAGKTIQDEPVLKGTEPGTMAFGKSGEPNSRSTHIFINFKDNSPMLSPQGFSSFAQVIEGLDAVNSIHVTGENPGNLQGSLSQVGGVATFIKNNPDVTIIERAYIR